MKRTFFVRDISGLTLPAIWSEVNGDVHCIHRAGTKFLDFHYATTPADKGLYSKNGQIFTLEIVEEHLRERRPKAPVARWEIETKAYRYIYHYLMGATREWFWNHPLQNDGGYPISLEKLKIVKDAAKEILL